LHLPDLTVMAASRLALLLGAADAAVGLVAV